MYFTGAGTWNDFLTADDMSAILAVKLRKRLGFGMWTKLHLTGMHVEGKVNKLFPKWFVAFFYSSVFFFLLFAKLQSFLLFHG